MPRRCSPILVAPASLEDEVALVVMRANNLTFGLGRGQEPLRCWTTSRPGWTTLRARGLASQTVPMLLFAGEVEESNARGGALIGGRPRRGSTDFAGASRGRGVRGDRATGDHTT